MLAYGVSLSCASWQNPDETDAAHADLATVGGVSHDDRVYPGGDTVGIHDHVYGRGCLSGDPNVIRRKVAPENARTRDSICHGVSRGIAWDGDLNGNASSRRRGKCGSEIGSYEIGRPVRSLPHGDRG